MKRVGYGTGTWIPSAALALAAAGWAGGEGKTIPLVEGVRIRIASAREAAEVLGTADGYVEAMSPFDRAVRARSAKPVPKEDLLAFFRGHAAEWTDEEEAVLRKAVAALTPRLEPLKLRLPEEIPFLKTTGGEEGGAAYCRGNAVVLPRTMSGVTGAELVAHELFHILSRQDEGLRDALYAVVGFERCGEVELPESIRARKITNPDAYTHAHALELKVGERTERVVPVLLSRSEAYDPAAGGTLFDYLDFRLMVIEKREGAWRARVDAKGSPALLRPDETPDYTERVGRNTRYVIHPEEILADNFALLVLQHRKVATPRILEGLRRVLEEDSAKR